MNSGLKIAYLSSETPLNKRVWSGTHHSIYTALKQIGSVEILGPYEPQWCILKGKILHKLSLMFFGKRYNYRHSHSLSKAYAAYFEKRIRQIKPDVIVAPAASCEIAHLHTNIPIIYISDGTFDSCLNYHKSLSNLNKKSLLEGHQIEQMAIGKSAQVIVSSAWAAKSVVNDYGKSENFVHTIPFGANFELLPEQNEIIDKSLKPFKLLFVGVYWQSKGGDIAYHAFKLLEKNGYDVTLTIVGCQPDLPANNDRIKCIKFIDKNSPDGQRHLADIYQQHHLLLLPTRFDCTPIVINEASAFGIPSLVSNTGGVEGHLKENQNGKLIPYTDKGELFAKAIEQLIVNPDAYLALRKNSRALYVNLLNWDHWLNEFKKLLPIKANV